MQSERRSATGGPSTPCGGTWMRWRPEGRDGLDAVTVGGPAVTVPANHRSTGTRHRRIPANVHPQRYGVRQHDREPGRRDHADRLGWRGFGHPLFDLGEMLMWAEADEPTCVMALKHYYGSLTSAEMRQRLTEVHSFQTIAALRLVTECLETDLDPFYHVTARGVRREHERGPPRADTSAHWACGNAPAPIRALWTNTRSSFPPEQRASAPAVGASAQVYF